MNPITRRVALPPTWPRRQCACGALVLGGLVSFLWLGPGLGLARAEAPRALSAGALPKDQRLNPPKDLDGYFPFAPSSSVPDWTQRADRVRMQMRVALGLWPAPPKTPLHPVIHGKIDQGDYTVEKVFFESVPGFFVTGNLYRPAGAPGKRPGVLCPHGHWDNGRFMDHGPERIRQEIAQGAERFEEGGRSVLQARCVQLARMGCVVFHYDMIGYADSQQIPMAIAHGFSRQRPEMTGPKDWGLFSPQAESYVQSVMGLQTWNSIRSLDFLLGLDDVDPERIAVTGASGGGTQTFVLCALDSRPAVAFPAVMVSTAMQGGCTCENASLLRIDTGNVEFAALFAPKPLGMTAANDWTREMPSKGFPELKQHYALLGAPENVMLKPLLHFEHNYNHISRSAMYSWLNKHFKLGLAEPILEADYKRLSARELSVWDDAHPRPEAGPEFERKLTALLADSSRQQLEKSRSAVETYQKLVGPALDVVIGRNLREVGTVAFSETLWSDRGPYRVRTGLLRNSTYREELPVIILEPQRPSGRAVIWASEAGKNGLFRSNVPTDQTIPKPEIKRMLEAGVTVVGVDLLYQGEFLADGKPVVRTPRVKNPRESAAYTFGYNRTVFAQRVHDILSVIRYLEPGPKTRVYLAGLDGTGPLVAAARAQAGAAIARTALQTRGFRFVQVADLQDPNFLPGGAKYGDLPGMLAAAVPGRLWIAGEGGQVPDVVADLYKKAGVTDHVRSVEMADEALPSAAVDWLLAE